MTHRFLKLLSILLGTGVAFLALSVLIRAPAEGQAPSATKRPSLPEDPVKKYKAAVVKIVIKQHGIPVTVGAGFFVSRDGLLVTNQHIMRQVIATTDFSAEFTMADKRVVKTFKVGNCSDKRGLDVCLLKLDVVSPTFFVFSENPPTHSESLLTIGHPRSGDFTAAKLAIKDIRQSGTGVGEIELTGPLGPGNSGGPIFDERGQLAGMVAKHSSDKNGGLGIISEEISNYRDFNQDTVPLAVARKKILDRIKTDIKNLAIGDIDHAMSYAVRAKKIDTVKGMKEVALDFAGEKMLLNLPSIFSDCKRATAGPGPESSGKPVPDSIVYACPGFGEAAVFSIQRFGARTENHLILLGGRQLLASKPVNVVEALKAEGTWDGHEKSLSAEKRKLFYSQVSPAQCSNLKSSTLKNAYFSEVPACRFTVSNDMEPGARSYNVWLDDGLNLYSFAIWMNDANLSEYFDQIPNLAVLTARSERALNRPSQPPTHPALAGTSVTQPTSPTPNTARGEALSANRQSDLPGKPQNTQTPRAIASDTVLRPLTTYKIELPEDVHFMAGRLDRSGLQLDLYGRRPPISSTFRDDYLLVVTNQKKGILPPDYDLFAKEFALEVARSLSFQSRPDTVEIEATAVEGKPARLFTGFGLDKRGNESIFLQSVIFEQDQVLVLIQITPSKDPIESFKKFKSLLSNLKRK